MKVFNHIGGSRNRGSASTRSRDSDEFEALALPLHNRLYRTALILTASPRYAKELVQETYSTTVKNYKGLERRESFAIWMIQYLIYTYMNDRGRFELNRKISAN